MAGIDKTYCKTWAEYKDVLEWAKSRTFKCPNGIILNPLDYMLTWEKKNFDECPFPIPIMNTPTELDYFLIRECPIKLVQDRMKEVYGEEFIKAVKGGYSEYDLFQRPLPGKKIKVIKKSEILKNKVTKGSYVSISVTLENGDDLRYNEDYDQFLFPFELGYWTSSGCDIKIGSLKAMLRRINKWRLPKGARVTVEGIKWYENWLFEIQ